MRRVAVLLTMFLGLGPAAAFASPQRAMTPAEERNAWQEAARTIPSGSVVRLDLTDGRRITGILIAATGDEVLIKERARPQRPALVVPLANVVRIERQEKKGINLAKAVATGAAAGAGAFVAFLAFALIVFDD